MEKIKILQTEDYFEDQEKNIGCKGLLILVEITEEDYVNNPHQGIKLINRKFYKPIIYSQTELLQIGDKFINLLSKKIEEYKNIDYGEFDPNKIKFCRKILAFPENFSENHLQDIVNGDLNDRDVVYLKAWDNTSINEDKEIVVYLDGNWHIKLFPIKK